MQEFAYGQQATSQPGAQPQGPGVATAGTTYNPTLLIGLGGTGAEVLLRVKKFLLERETSHLDLHRFLFLDTDKRTFATHAGLPPIDPNEQCLIGVRSAETLLKAPQHLHRFIWERFPPDQLQKVYIRKLAEGIGAGQIRSLGALAYVLDYASVCTRLTQAYNAVRDIGATAKELIQDSHAQIGSKVMIYVVGSLAGGTGSGCFLDVALTARSICGLEKTNLIGVFALPDAFDEKVKTDKDQVDSIRANTYAALRELQFVLDAGAPERSTDVAYDYGDNVPLKLDRSDQVFTFLYLVDKSNQMGSLPRIESLYELMARTIYQDVASPFGAAQLSFASNVGVKKGTAVCPETGRPREISTVATAALVYPAPRVATYSTYRSLAEVLRDAILGRPPSSAELEASVTAFLGAQRLEERGSNNQILDGLLSDPNRGERISSGSLGLGTKWGDERDAKTFVSLLEEQWNRQLAEDVPKIEEMVEDNLVRRLRDERDAARLLLNEAVADWALGMSVEFGVTGVGEALKLLTQVAQQMKRELTKELDEWVQQGQGEAKEEFDKL
ncbi:MAG: hypothetical protein JXB46_02120, partial [Candidatus Eisenbacteria bacterium]|nr:hypothetical protein [Candidatus Eisenbacteria bacterium]